MKTTEALFRGFNLLAVSIIAVAGFAFAGEIFGEPEIAFKIDDILLLLLALISIGWYLNGTNRFVRSWTPVVLIVCGLLIKIGGVFVEIHDTADVGDDFGGVILVAIGAGLVIYQFLKTKKLVASSETIEA